MDRIVDLIRSKRYSEEISPEDYERLITGFTLDEIPDAQMGALLMAGVCNGFSANETNALTSAMLGAGRSWTYLDLTRLGSTATPREEWATRRR